MAAHRLDRIGAGSDNTQEIPSEATCSRRRFFMYSAAGAAGSFLAGRVPASADTVVSPVAVATDFVVQPTPSWYFIHRGNGSEEMKWGPVGRAAPAGEAHGYGDTTPNDRLYIHNRARPPRIDRRAWRLKVTGDAITRPRSFTYEDLLALPAVTLRRTIDCGANCSAFFPKLPPSGADDRWLPVGYTQWHFGAVGAAEWTGVRARDVLAAAGVDRPLDVKFTGLDISPTPATPAGRPTIRRSSPPRRSSRTTPCWCTE
jgi:DMSO/TMAO reductase YedYZ molybdopterin-dependent catalytic subunit